MAELVKGVNCDWPDEPDRHTPTTVYVLFVNYNDGTQDVACGVFTSAELALKYLSDRYTYRVEKFSLNEHA